MTDYLQRARLWYMMETCKVAQINNFTAAIDCSAFYIKEFISIFVFSAISKKLVLKTAVNTNHGTYDMQFVLALLMCYLACPITEITRQQPRTSTAPLNAFTTDQEKKTIVFAIFIFGQIYFQCFNKF